MKAARILILLPALVLLGACAQQIYYREGASVTQIQRDRDACELQAMREAPVLSRTRVLPGRWIPGRKVCDSSGNCTVTPGYQTFPEFETYDANTERRALLARTCLAERGIDRISLPLCDGAVKAAVPVGVTRVLPPLGERSCVIPRGAAGYQVVTPQS